MSSSETAIDCGPWTKKHLLGTEDLSITELETIFKASEFFVEASRNPEKKHSFLKGKVIANLFFESSTRTRVSFGLAARRLGAETIDFSPAGSSVSKGESFIDTAKNILALGVNGFIIRHSVPGTPHLLAQQLGVSIINAGDGAHEHPTQGLLDAFTILQEKKKIKGLTVGLVGDITHSRVARSNIHTLTKLGAKVIVCGPPTLIPKEIEELGVRSSYDLDKILPECDVVNVLRIQFERQRSGLFPSIQEYFRLFGMTMDRVKKCRPDMLLLAPGPINRGIELTPEVADMPNSAILKQVTNGLAVRMAVLYLALSEKV